MKSKQNKNQELYASLILYFTEEIYKQHDKKILDMQKEQKKNRDKLLKEIIEILLSYTIIDSVMSLKPIEIKKIYSRVKKVIVDNIQSELKKETYITKDILKNVGKIKYDTNNYIYSLGKNFKLTQVDDSTLDKIINTKVDNETWSKRLWANKNKTCKDLKEEVKNFLKGKTNINEIETVIKDKYNSNAFNTRRLVQDNICRVQEGCNDEWQHKHGIKKVMYLATLDVKVCSKCAKYDSEVFNLDEKPVVLGQHPFCRCVYVSLVSDDWKPSKRYDNQNKQNIDWTTYKEWSENQKS